MQPIQTLIFSFITSVFLVPISIRIGLLPNIVNWIVEIYSIIFFLISVLIFSIQKRAFKLNKYLINISLMITTVILSGILNKSQPSEIIIGLRYYFKFLPFFIFPLIYKIQFQNIKKIFYFLLFFCIIQFPISIIQRFFIYKNIGTGDVVTGTMANSGTLSVVLISAMAVIFSFYINQKIGLIKFLIIGICLFIPTTINETKATFILFPIGICFPLILIKDLKFYKKVNKLFTAIFISITFMSIFVYFYNTIYQEHLNKDLFTSFKLEMEGRGYLYRGESLVEREEKIGRIDTIIIAYKTLSKDFGTLLFGRGIGSIKSTKLGFFEKGISEIEQYKPGSTTLTMLFWELGLLGLLFYMFLLFFLIKDTMIAKNKNLIVYSLTIGWATVSVIVFLVTPYLNIFDVNAINTLFWFCSGLVLSCQNGYQEKK